METFEINALFHHNAERSWSDEEYERTKDHRQSPLKMNDRQSKLSQT